MPFTIKEFIGKDPVEPGKAWLGRTEWVMENGTPRSLQAMSNDVLCANDNICTLRIDVKSPDGKVLDSYVPLSITNPAKLICNMKGLLDEARLKPFADGKNTIHIYAQLSNGEFLEAFNTILKVD